MKEKRQVVLFFAVAVLFNMAASFAHPVTPTIIQDRGFGDYMFGVALASMLTVNFLFSPFWGKIITFVSSRTVILVCAIGYAIGQGLFGVAQTERAMVIARMFAGMFTSGAFTGLLTYVVNTSPTAQRGNYLTAAATIQTVAGAFGFFVGGMLGELDVRYAIIAQVATLSFGGILFYFVCEDDRSGDMMSARELVRQANPLAAFAAGKDFMTPVFAALFAICTLAGIGATAFDHSFNYYLRAQLGLSSGYNGAIKAVIGLISLGANATIGLWLINRTDIRRSSIYIHLLCTLAMLGVVLIDDVVPFVGFNFLYFGFFAISVPLTQNLVAASADGKDSNLIMGYYGGLKSLGGIVGALFAGLLYAAHPKYPFVLGVVAFALATLAAVDYLRRSRSAATVARSA